MPKKLMGFGCGLVVGAALLFGAWVGAIILDSTGMVSVMLDSTWHNDHLAIAGMLLSVIAFIGCCALLGEHLLRRVESK